MMSIKAIGCLTGMACEPRFWDSVSNIDHTAKHFGFESHLFLEKMILRIGYIKGKSDEGRRVVPQLVPHGTIRKDGTKIVSLED